MTKNFQNNSDLNYPNNPFPFPPLNIPLDPNNNNEFPPEFPENMSNFDFGPFNEIPIDPNEVNNFFKEHYGFPHYRNRYKDKYTNPLTHLILELKPFTFGRFIGITSSF